MVEGWPTNKGERQGKVGLVDLKPSLSVLINATWPSVQGVVQ